MLEINKLQKKYENFELNCSMKVEKGYITALVGENSERQSEDGNCFDRFGIQRIFKSKRYHTGDGVAIYRI